MGVQWGFYWDVKVGHVLGCVGNITEHCCFAR